MKHHWACVYKSEIENFQKKAKNVSMKHHWACIYKSEIQKKKMDKKCFNETSLGMCI